MRVFGLLPLCAVQISATFEPLTNLVKPLYEQARTWWQENAGVTLPTFEELVSGGSFPDLTPLLTSFAQNEVEAVSGQAAAQSWEGRYVEPTVPLHGNFPTFSGAVLNLLNIPTQQEEPTHRLRG